MQAAARACLCVRAAQQRRRREPEGLRERVGQEPRPAPRVEAPLPERQGAARQRRGRKVPFVAAQGQSRPEGRGGCLGLGLALSFALHTKTRCWGLVGGVCACIGWGGLGGNKTQGFCFLKGGSGPRGREAPSLLPNCSNLMNSKDRYLNRPPPAAALCWKSARVSQGSGSSRAFIEEKFPLAAPCGVQMP